MGTEQDSNFYDAYWRSRRSHFRPHKTPWYLLWSLAARLIHKAGKRRVVDMGCGPGFLAELLNSDVAYVGYDFAPYAIHRARKRYAKRKDTTFMLKDVHSFDGSEFSGVDAVVCCELLEHIDQDLALLEKVPVGTWIYLTVPNFDIAQHVRHFRNHNAVSSRYTAVMKVNTVRQITKYHFAAWGVRR